MDRNPEPKNEDRRNRPDRRVGSDRPYVGEERRKADRRENGL